MASTTDMGFPTKHRSDSGSARFIDLFLTAICVSERDRNEAKNK